MMGRLATGIALVMVLAIATHADDRREAIEKAKRRAAETARKDGPHRTPVNFPRADAITGGLSAQAAISLWPQFSIALHDRMYRGERKFAVNVIGSLEGADTSVIRAKDDRQRGAALAQIQGVCALFLTTPGIPLTPVERDTLAAYSMKAGEARMVLGKQAPRRR